MVWPSFPEIKFEPVGIKPENFCGTLEDYEKEPVRAIFDLLMFFESDGTQKKEFCGRPLKNIPPHILPFIVSRLFNFTKEKKRYSLDAAFGLMTGKQRDRILADARNREIISEIWFNPERIKALYNEELSELERKKIVQLSAEEANGLANKFGLSPDMIRRIAKKSFFKWS